MVLSQNINNREFDKFELNTDGETAVRVIAEIGNGTIAADFSPAGLDGRRIFVVTVTDTATQIDSALSRESIQFINEGPNPLKYGHNLITFTGSGRGMPVGTDEGVNEDTKQTAPVFGICDTGKSTELVVMELYKT